MSSQSGVVFDIERFSVHDGPGIRTVVFLKGCALRCEWCANPESQDPRPQLGFFSEQCLGCNQCVSVCPQGDCFAQTGLPAFDKCIRCFKCRDLCLPEARVVYGQTLSVDEVMKKVRADKPFYASSGGGVTLSGGEAALQPDFAAAILKTCREEGIHTALESCGFVVPAAFERVVRHVDCLLFDLKCMDDAVHRRYTGGSNRQILENARLARRIVPEMIIRIPLIPGVNDSADNIRQTAAFIRSDLPGTTQIDLLPYHSMGKSKCLRIGKAYPFEPKGEITDEKLRAFQAIFASFDLTASIGG